MIETLDETAMRESLDEAAVEAFRGDLRGELLRPGDAGYDDARQVFNRMIDKRPALIARCSGTADVVKAVKFARVHDLLVAVRGGGHNVTGAAVCDGGIVIDLSQMKGLQIDPVARVARAEAGLTWGELNTDLQLFDLGATGGYISTTGVSGLTLGGGLGWLVRKHGLACDNLLSADVVTADGRLLKASRNEHDDLFWGLRGGGGNLGIVTSLEFQVHPVGLVLAGLLLHPIERTDEVLRFFRDYVATAPDELTSGVILLTAPEAPFVPETLRGSPVAAISVAYTGPLEAGEQVVRPLREFAPPLADLVQPMPYSVLQTLADIRGWTPGFQHYWKSNFLRNLGDGAIDTLVTYFARVPSPESIVVVDHNGGGAISRVGVDETAFAHRGWTFNFLISSAWAADEDAEENIRWAREFWEAMQPFASEAVYVNYLSAEGEERVRAAYGTVYERLVALKTKYDPTNFFHLNQNISPERTSKVG